MNIVARAKIKLFLIIFMTCPVFLVHSNQLPIDNLSILSKLTSEIVDSVFQRLHLDSSDAVLIQSANKEDCANWVVENELVKKLLQSANDIIIGESANSKINYFIEYRIIRFGVDYLPTSKKDLIQRKILVNLKITTSRGQHSNVDLYKNFTRQFVDSVRISEIQKLESERYPFTQSQIVLEPGFGKYIEPIIVMATTVGIVYLFFQLRSN